MRQDADFSWVGVDGALHSGNERELALAFASGALPEQHPIWRQGWPAWLLLAEARAAGRVSLTTDEPEAASTRRDPPRFEEPETPSTSPYPRAPEAYRPRLDPDATAEELTRPIGIAALNDFSRDSATTTTPLAPHTHEPRAFAERPPAPGPHALRASLPPGGTAHTLPPPLARNATRRGVPMLIGITLAAIGAVAAAGIVALAPSGPNGRTLQSGFALPSLGAPRAPQPVAVRCSMRQRESDLGERFAPETSLHLAPGAPGQLRVGFARSDKSGVGLMLSLGSLSVVNRTAFADPVHLGGVVPLAEGGEAFAVDRFTRTVDASDAFSLGMTPAGFCRIAADGTQTTIWPGQAREVISRPAVQSVGTQGFAVAFRRGDAERGVVHFGWLDSRGAKRGELGTFGGVTAQLEAPSLATDSKRALVAYAVRQSNTGLYGIELGLAAPGEPPTGPTHFGGGNASRDQRRPAVAALPGGHWLLAWSEGDKQTGRRVRVQVVDANLQPAGPPLDVAEPSHFVGSIAVFGSGSASALLFTERRRADAEVLRVVGLDCR